MSPKLNVFLHKLPWSCFVIAIEINNKTPSYLPSPLMPAEPLARHCNRSLSIGSVAVESFFLDWIAISRSWRAVPAIWWENPQHVNGVYTLLPTSGWAVDKRKLTAFCSLPSRVQSQPSQNLAFLTIPIVLLVYLQFIKLQRHPLPSLWTISKHTAISQYALILPKPSFPPYKQVLIEKGKVSGKGT
jgi:hypothetical protein